ncbi:MAG: NnrU family protein, partial [Alphaproteobacteria bacterium]
MNGLEELALAMAVFIVAHMIPSHRPLRGAFIGMLGEWGFRGAYSVLSLGLFWWLIQAYLGAPDVELYTPITFFRHLPMTLMLPVCLLVVGGYSIANPSAVVLEKIPTAGGVPGVLKITRHPVLWAVVIWAVAHMLANPDGAAWILFGSLAGLSVAGAVHIDARKRAEGGA